MQVVPEVSLKYWSFRVRKYDVTLQNLCICLQGRDYIST